MDGLVKPPYVPAEWQGFLGFGQHGKEFAGAEKDMDRVGSTAFHPQHECYDETNVRLRCLDERHELK